MNQTLECKHCGEVISNNLLSLQNLPDSTKWVKAGYCSYRCFELDNTKQPEIEKQTFNAKRETQEIVDVEFPENSIKKESNDVKIFEVRIGKNSNERYWDNLNFDPSLLRKAELIFEGELMELGTADNEARELIARMNFSEIEELTYKKNAHKTNFQLLRIISLGIFSGIGVGVGMWFFKKDKPDFEFSQLVVVSFVAAFLTSLFYAIGGASKVFDENQTIVLIKRKGKTSIEFTIDNSKIESLLSAFNNRNITPKEKNSNQ
jgi:hypothetical protein